jgi:hypothetical protein
MFSKKLGTLIYVTDLMNHLADIGAREEMRKLGQQNIISYIGDDDHKAQLFLEYIYVGNRVGANVNNGILDSKVIFSTWTREWWVDLWGRLKPFVQKERERRKDPELYIKFERFVGKIK